MSLDVPDKFCSCGRWMSDHSKKMTCAALKEQENRLFPMPDDDAHNNAVRLALIAELFDAVNAQTLPDAAARLDAYRSAALTLRNKYTVKP